MASIPDITDTEKWIIQTTMKERYRPDMEIQLSDSETRLHASDRELSSCPVMSLSNDDLSECIVTLRQARADLAAKQKGELHAA